MSDIRNGLERRQTERRAEIVKTAAKLFFEKGYGRTSMDDVINVIGGSKRTLYAHFSRKEDLFAAIVNEVSGKVLQKFEVEVKANLEDSLRAIGEQYMEALLSEEALMLYRAIVSEAQYFPELAQSFFENGPKKILNRVVELFAFHERAGSCKVREPKTTAKLFIGMVRGDHHMAAVLTGKTISRPQIKRFVAAAVETLMHGALIESAKEAKV